MEKINLKEKLGLFSALWSPQIIAELNGQEVKLVKFQGEFVWHSHAAEDELFLVIEGEFDMHFRDKIITLSAGECIVVPRGVEHKPVAEKEVSVLLFEPSNMLNTGNVISEHTKFELGRI